MPLGSFEAERQELRGRVAELSRERDQMMEELDDRLILNCIPVVGSFHEKLHALIRWEYATALDPQVSIGARKLIRVTLQEVAALNEENTALKATIQRLEREIAGARCCLGCAGDSFICATTGERFSECGCENCESGLLTQMKRMKCPACINGVTWPKEEN